MGVCVCVCVNVCSYMHAWHHAVYRIWTNSPYANVIKCRYITSSQELHPCSPSSPQPHGSHSQRKAQPGDETSPRSPCPSEDIICMYNVHIYIYTYIYIIIKLCCLMLLYKYDVILFYMSLCYVMLFYFMLCHVMLQFVILYYIVLRCTVSHYTIIF